MGEIRVRLAVSSDCEQLSRLRQALWPDASAAEHRKEIASIVAGEYNGTMPMAIFVAETSGPVLAGFLEVGLRSHADGCDPRHPVEFVEGWFVMEDHRSGSLQAGVRLDAMPIVTVSQFLSQLAGDPVCSR